MKRKSTAKRGLHSQQFHTPLFNGKAPRIDGNVVVNDHSCPASVAPFERIYRLVDGDTHHASERNHVVLNGAQL